MAVPSSGAIDLKDLQDEFGGSNPISISEYYRNGGLVPSNNTDVPTSGTVALSDFYGAVNEIGVTASAASSADLQTLFNNASANSWTSTVPKRYTINGGTNMGILTVPASMGGTLIIDIASGATVRGTGGVANTSPGAGGSGNSGVGAAGGAGGAAGHAISVASTGVTVNVVGSLQGGGGGGGAGGGGGGGGQGRTTYSSGSTCFMNGYCPGACNAGCGGFLGGCGPDEDSYYLTNCYKYTYHTGGAGGAGGNSGKGQGYVSASGSGASGSGGSSASNAGTGGAGGAGGNGGAYGAAGSAGTNGSTGANSYGNGGAGGAGGAAGAAGRAVFFNGISAYTIIGTSSGTIAGAYT